MFGGDGVHALRRDVREWWSIVAGACDPTCDPAHQCAATPTPIACGSTMAATPNKGCYGISQFSCAVVPSGALTLTDRMPAQTGGSGGTILNGCAPGFLPFLISMTGSTTAICSGVCAALETDNTPAHANNAKGDPKAFGKLPTMAGLSEGNATCEIGKKGSEATSACRFMWQYVVDDQGVLPASFTPFVDKLGICMGRTHYQYDSNGDGTVGGADATQPDCATLPPRSAATTGNYDDAADFGCQLLSHSMVAGALPLPDPDMRAVQATDAAVAVVRHDFR
ncbi:MAG: hypothetical protein IPQ07_11780 [Myxococcales bacterium]|nr:hypothetical protein [Myxococcales bacterium]